MRLSLEKAVIILDYDQAKDFTNIAFKISEEVVNEGFVSDDQLKVDLLRLLLIRHKFVDSLVARGVQPGGKLDGLKRSFSKASMAVSVFLHTILNTRLNIGDKLNYLKLACVIL